MFAAKEQNFKICNFSTRSLSVTLSQPIMIPNNFHFIESIPLLYREMLISETAVINIYIGYPTGRSWVINLSKPT